MRGNGPGPPKARIGPLVIGCATVGSLSDLELARCTGDSPSPFAGIMQIKLKMYEDVHMKSGGFALRVP